VASKQVAAARIEVNLPAPTESAAKKTEPQEVSIRAEANGQVIGEAKLRVDLRKRALPQ
jgi:biopolymer transport protein ExbD